MRTAYNNTTVTIESNNHRGRAWIAEITGLDAKYGLARTFVPKRDVTSARSNVYRDNEWVLDLTDGTIYEYRDIDASSGGGDSGYWQVQQGQLVELSKAEVVEELRKR
jgi:hypothetical protein